jgi:hypothetical protein
MTITIINSKDVSPVIPGIFVKVVDVLRKGICIQDAG